MTADDHDTTVNFSLAFLCWCATRELHRTSERLIQTKSDSPVGADFLRNVSRDIA